MATFKICVFRHQRRGIDGKYPVSIRVYWQKKSAYISTEYYVESEQITQNKRKNIFELKDTAIIAELTSRIKTYEKAKTDKLGIDIYNYTASDLARYFEELTQNKSKDLDIDFLEFARGYISAEEGKGRNVHRVKASINALSDFSGSKLSVHNLTSKYLTKFTEHLKTERKVTRKNQFGKNVTVTNKPVSATTVAGYMTDIRTIFNAALNEFNDDEKGIVKINHYPFKKYKVPRLPQSKKRNIQGRQLYRISKFPESFIKLERSIIARDAFMLSFMLIGMNFKDIYELRKSDYKNGRITYSRAKTRDRREDGALISIKVEPEALKYIEKFKDPNGGRLFYFHRRYVNSQGFVSAMSKGLKRVSEVAGIGVALSTYYARHSWATIARNKCGISKSDIDECLNHVNEETKMADVYIEKDWSLIDRSNRKILDYVFDTCNPRKVFVKKVTSKSIKFVRKCGKNKSGSFSEAALEKPIS